MLTFSVQSLLLVLRHLRDAAANFLETPNAITAAMNTLEAAADSGITTEFSWNVPDTDGRRIRTTTASDYEPGGGGHHSVFGELSFVWQLRLHDPSRSKNRQNVQVANNASIKLRIVDASSSELLAQWQIEMGSANSPGCFFHSAAGQVEGLHFFPRTLSIPRLPTILVTPSDALDFLIGELFQDAWCERQAHLDDALRGWSNAQKFRLSALLQWKSEMVRKATGSPWNWLKRQKPETGLFLP